MVDSLYRVCLPVLTFGQEIEITTMKGDTVLLCQGWRRSSIDKECRTDSYCYEGALDGFLFAAVGVRGEDSLPFRFEILAAMTDEEIYSLTLWDVRKLLDIRKWS